MRVHKFTFIDLFSGIGGFHLGLAAAGGECLYSNEWDQKARQTYQAWTGHIPDERDLRTVDFSNDIPNHDVLAAGFPCQPFSIAGVSKKNSMGRKHGFEDERQGNLFFSIAEIAAIHKPKVIFLENVKNLRSHDRGNTWNVIRQSLEDMGYHVMWQVINAKYWVPQNRERIFIVALRQDLWSVLDSGRFRFPEGDKSRPPILENILENEPSRELMLSEPLWAYLVGYAAKHRERGNGFGYSIAPRASNTRTLSARYYKDGSEILIDERDWERPRRLSVNEARLLMGFTREISLEAGRSGEYPQVVSNAQAYKQFGNSVAPPVVRDIALEIGRFLAEV